MEAQVVPENVMKKYVCEVRSFDDLRPGDLVGVSFGFLRFKSQELLEAGYRRLTLIGAHGEVYHETHHHGNWPEVAIGFTPEYHAAYQAESFG